MNEDRNNTAQYKTDYQDNVQQNEIMREDKVPSYNLQNNQKEDDLEQKRQRSEGFRILGLASFLYSIVFTFCIYDNFSAVTMPIWVGATVVYVCWVMRRMNVERKTSTVLYLIGMILLGISTALTGNFYVIFLNYVGIFLLLLTFLLHNFHDARQWGIGKNVSEMINAVFGALGCIIHPFTEGRAFFAMRQTNPGKKQKLYLIVVGVLIAIPAVCILGMCLASADAVFAHLFETMFQGVQVQSNVIGILIMLLFGFFASYSGMRYLSMRQKTVVNKNTEKHNATIAITFISILVVMYVVFSSVQVIYLFLGFGTLPDGMTYADYARSGFFQVLFVVIVNLFLVLGVNSFFEESKILKTLLLVVCGCTYVMVASSAYRMILYIQAYQLTFLRILVLVALGAIATLLVGAILTLYRVQFPFFRYGVVVITIFYIGFSFAHVDYLIARYNLSHMTMEQQEEQLAYIQGLSTDAAPAIMDYLKSQPELKKKIEAKSMKQWKEEYEPYSGDTTDWYFIYLNNKEIPREHTSLRRFNVSRYIASKCLILN